MELGKWKLLDNGYKIKYWHCHVLCKKVCVVDISVHFYIIILIPLFDQQ